MEVRFSSSLKDFGSKKVVASGAEGRIGFLKLLPESISLNRHPSVIESTAQSLSENTQPFQSLSVLGRIPDTQLLRRRISRSKVVIHLVRWVYSFKVCDVFRSRPFHRQSKISKNLIFPLIFGDITCLLHQAPIKTVPLHTDNFPGLQERVRSCSACLSI